MENWIKKKERHYAIISKTHVGTCTSFEEVLGLLDKEENKNRSKYKGFDTEEEAQEWIIEMTKPKPPTFKKFVPPKKKRKVIERKRKVSPLEEEEEEQNSEEH